MIGGLQLKAVIATAAFTAGAASGAWLTNALHKAEANADLKDEIERLKGQLESQSEQSREAISVTRVLDGIVSAATAQWNLALSQMDIEIQPIRVREKEVIREIDRIDGGECFDKPLPPRLCVLEARSLGIDPDVSCPAGDTDG